ncbi:MAG: hypothetical protein V3T70_00945 [Phycisphaerae bacterium]
MHWKRWAGILAVAAAARGAVILYAAIEPARFDYPDSRRYALVAANIASGRGPIESPRNRTGTDPLYPYLIAPALVGAQFDWPAARQWALNDVEQVVQEPSWVVRAYTWARVVNLIFGVAAVAAVMAVALRLAGPTAAAAAGLIASLDPILVFFHALVLTEVVYLALLWGGVYLAVRGTASRSYIMLIAAGILFGCGAAARSSGLIPAVLLPAIVVWCVAGAIARGARLAAFGTMLLGVALAVSPAAWRNHGLIGTWMPIRTGGGASLLEACGPWADGGPGMQKVAWPTVADGANERARDRIYRDAALDWARAHPADAVRLALIKLVRTWSISPNAPGYQSGLYAAIGWLTVAPVFVLAAVGAWLRRRDRMTALLLAPALCFSLIHMVFVGSVRYRVPAMPGLFILAGVAVAGLLQRRARREPDANSGAQPADAASDRH